MEPLSLSFITPYRAFLKISGPLMTERLPALEAAIPAANEAIKDAAQKAGGKIDILLDMTGFDGTYDVQAMEAFASFAKANREFIHKTAGFGAADKAEMAGEMVAALADRDNIKFFPTLEEATQWLEA